MKQFEIYWRQAVYTLRWDKWVVTNASSLSKLASPDEIAFFKKLTRTHFIILIANEGPSARPVRLEIEHVRML